MAPNDTRPEPTETSPLLGQPDQNKQLVDPGDGIAPAGPVPYDDTDVEDTEDGGALERQTTNGSNFKHQGLPEVRKRMKYIFPAIAIGVSSPHRMNFEQKLNLTGLPFRSRSDSHRLYLWNHRHRPEGSVIDILDSNSLLSYFDRISTPLRQAQRHLRP